MGIIQQVIVGGVSIHFGKKWREIFTLLERVFAVLRNKIVSAFVINSVEPYGHIAA